MAHVSATEIAARTGYAARGVVYLLVGGLAVLAETGRGGQTPDSRGALVMLLNEPFGTVLLAAIGIGLLAYSIWRAIQAIFDADSLGTDAKGIAFRGGQLVSAFLHLGLAYFVWKLISGSGGGGWSQAGLDDWTAQLMSQPFGIWLVGLVGVAVAGAGIVQGVKGWKAKFDRYLVMDPSTRRCAYPVCRFGLVIRGFVFVIIGGFFMVAAWQTDPSEAGGLAEALDTLRAQPYGSVLVGIVAIGLVAFGVYCIVESIYRRIDPPHELASVRVA